MRIVRDGTGARLYVVKENHDATLVHDPATGTDRFVPNDDLDPVDGETFLEAAAASVPANIRTAVTAIRDDRGLGFIAWLVDTGPKRIVDILEETDLCESDVHGLTGEFRAAGFIEPTTVAGEPGYEATDRARDVLATLRSARG